MVNTLFPALGYGSYEAGIETPHYNRVGSEIEKDFLEKNQYLTQVQLVVHALQ
jgi:hypothetical protein